MGHLKGSAEDPKRRPRVRNWVTGNSNQRMTERRTLSESCVLTTTRWRHQAQFSFKQYVQRFSPRHRLYMRFLLVCPIDLQTQDLIKEANIELYNEPGSKQPQLPNNYTIQPDSINRRRVRKGITTRDTNIQSYSGTEVQNSHLNHGS